MRPTMPTMMVKTATSNAADLTSSVLRGGFAGEGGSRVA
jgi:hypothetical protein